MTRPADTSPEAWEVLLDTFRKMSPEEKFLRTLELSEFLRAVCEAGVRAEYPNASDREIFLGTTQRTLGKELFARAYGDLLPSE